MYNLSPQISSASTTIASVAFIKRPAPIDPAVPIATQIQVMNLPGLASLSNAQAQQGTSMSPYEILHLLVHHGLSPYFEAYTRNQDAVTGSKPRTDTEAKTGVPGTKKKFAELELGLLHLQQNVEIPALNLPLHEVVQAALDDAESRGVKPSVELIPPEVLENSAFINSIQNTVNAWIRSIQTITKMSRDADSGSAAQEINFWLSMETALEGIENQLRGDGVQLTMDILRHAKRYQATLSFVADTGLREATDLVQKYNQLMRDFPLDELLSATTL